MATSHERVQEALRRFDAELDAKKRQDAMSEFERGLALAIFDTDQFETMNAANRVAVAVGAYLEGQG